MARSITIDVDLDDFDTDDLIEEVLCRYKRTNSAEYKSQIRKKVEKTLTQMNFSEAQSPNSKATYDWLYDIQGNKLVPRK